MKRSILVLAALFTFSTSLMSCRDTERQNDEVEMETTMDDDVNTNNDLNGTTRGGNMDNTTTTPGTNTTENGTTTSGTTTGDNTTGTTTGGTNNTRNGGTTNNP